MDALVFTVAGLAVWRVSHLLTQEDGPFDVVFYLRKAAGNSVFGQMLDCFYCTSVWVALAVTFWLPVHGSSFVLTWLGLSGFAGVIFKALTKT